MDWNQNGLIGVNRIFSGIRYSKKSRMYRWMSIYYCGQRGSFSFFRIFSIATKPLIIYGKSQLSFSHSYGCDK